MTLSDNSLRVDVYVDDTKIGTTTVPNPPPAGDVGVAVNGFTPDAIAASFANLHIYGPDEG